MKKVDERFSTFIQKLWGKKIAEKTKKNRIFRESNELGEDVDLDELAKKTVNYSGAELEELICAAQSHVK